MTDRSTESSAQPNEADEKSAVLSMLNSDAWQKRLDAARVEREKVLAGRERKKMPHASPFTPTQSPRIDRLPQLEPASIEARREATLRPVFTARPFRAQLSQLSDDIPDVAAPPVAVLVARPAPIPDVGPIVETLVVQPMPQRVAAVSQKKRSSFRIIAGFGLGVLAGVGASTLPWLLRTPATVAVADAPAVSVGAQVVAAVAPAAAPAPDVAPAVVVAEPVLAAPAVPAPIPLQNVAPVPNLTPAQDVALAAMPDAPAPAVPGMLRIINTAAAMTRPAAPPAVPEPIVAAPASTPPVVLSMIADTALTITPDVAAVDQATISPDAGIQSGSLPPGLVVGTAGSDLPVTQIAATAPPPSVQTLSPEQLGVTGADDPGALVPVRIESPGRIVVQAAYLDASADPMPAAMAPAPAPATPAAQDLAEKAMGAMIAGYSISVLAPTSLPDSELALATAGLQEAGFTLRAPARVEVTVKTQHVRFYHDEDRATAEILAGKIGGPARDFTQGENRPPLGTIELWLPGNTPKVAKAKPAKPVKHRAVAPAVAPAPRVAQDDAQIRALRDRIAAKLKNGG